MQHYSSYRAFIEKKFGEPIRTIPLNGGFTCPNRDGTSGALGCVFCSNASFSPVSATRDTVLAQLESGIEQSKKRFRKFIGYFQPYSNTYASVNVLKNLYEPIINHPDVVGLSVGTRPDCFSPDIYDYCADVHARTYLCVELGLQSSHDSTLLRIRRGHTFSQFCETVEHLHTRGIETAAHIILGLPGETEEMMLATAKQLAQLPVQGVKFHQLMVIEGTPLCEEYRTGTFEVLNLLDYAQILSKCIEVMRPDQHIHRLMASASVANGLVAPLWSTSKQDALNALGKHMEANDVFQGKSCLKDLSNPFGVNKLRKR